MTLANFLDLGKLAAGSAEPDMHVRILHSDFLGEIGDLDAGVTCGLQRSEDFLFQRTTGSTALGLALRGDGLLHLGCRASGTSLFGRASAALSGLADGFAGEQGGELSLDLFDFVNELLLALGEFHESAQGTGINFGEIHNDVCYFISIAS